MLAPLIREMIAAEKPVLDAHGLTMWGYVVLSALDRSSIRTQADKADGEGVVLLDRRKIADILLPGLRSFFGDRSA